MKKLFYLLAASLCMIVLTSCEKEDDDNKVTWKIPEYCLNANGWLWVANGETLKFGLELDVTKSSKGVYIESIDYYWDGKSIGVVSNSPFEVNYAIRNEKIGVHKLKAIVKIKGEGYMDIESTTTADIHVLEKPFVLKYDVEFDEGVDSLLKEGVKDGDTISGTVSLSDETSFECRLEQFDCYWDDKLVSATAINPYRFSYKVEKQAKGKHELKLVCHTISDIGKFTNTYRWTITVKE